MLITLAALVLFFLIIRGIALSIRRFWLWLGRGRDLESARSLGAITPEPALMAEGPDGQPVADLHRRLSPRQRKQARLATRERRERYLDELKIGWYQVVFIFIGGSWAGLVLEEIWMLVTAGIWQSRVGLVWGPFSPLYGVGAVLLTLVAFDMRRRGAKVWQIFLVSAVVGGALEQVTGWGMETLFHAQSWTYAHLPDHITQWLAWRFLAIWGLLGLVWTKLIMPDLLFRIGQPTTYRQVTFVAILTVYLAADIFLTVACFDRRTARDAGVPPHNSFESWVDENFTDHFMSSRFQNLVIGGEL